MNLWLLSINNFCFATVSPGRLIAHVTSKWEELNKKHILATTPNYFCKKEQLNYIFKNTSFKADHISDQMKTEFSFNIFIDIIVNTCNYAHSKHHSKKKNSC